jgi:hypothetical protein
VNLNDLFAEVEAQALAEGRALQKAEDAAWAALSPEEKAAKLAAQEAKWAALDDLPEDEDEDEDEDEGEEDE